MAKNKQGSFFDKVYNIVAQIPPGQVATYGQIALLAGRPRAARQVGYAMAGATRSRGVPCHRVVNRLGELAPDYVFGGREFQRMLLVSEGVGFLPDGRIDLERFLWRRPAPQIR